MWTRPITGHGRPLVLSHFVIICNNRTRLASIVIWGTWFVTSSSRVERCPVTIKNLFWSKRSFEKVWVQSVIDVIRKCDSSVYYKVRRGVVTKCDSYFITKCDWGYYKVRLVLQSVIAVITKCDRYYKVRRLSQSATVHLMPIEQAFSFISTRHLTNNPRDYYLIHLPCTLLVSSIFIHSQKRVIYNRVGKCGSRTMIQLMTALAKKNDFTVVGSTRFKLLHISLKEQVGAQLSQ